MRRMKLSDLVEIISEREDNPSSSIYDKFVGLEHYDSGEVVIKRYCSTAKLASAMKVFQKGDVLVARRNVYLRRAAMVDFDGLTSGDSIVLRSKNEKNSSLIPFILNTDSFWNYADKYADGTMSKRLSPEIMLNYEFDFPEEDEIDNLSELLWQTDEMRNKYKQLLSLTDDLVKSQFSELFKNCENTILSEISTIIMGQSPDSASYNDDGDGLPFFQGKADFGEKYTEVKHFTTDPSKIAEQGDTLISVRAPVGPVNVASVKCCIGRGLAAIRAKDQVATNEFIYEMLRSKEDEIASMGTGSTFKAINKNNLYNLEVPSAPLSLQNRFADFVKHIDKSKFITEILLKFIKNMLNFHKN